jgi:hypothetical protein
MARCDSARAASGVAQAIKGDEEFAQRVLKAVGKNPVARMNLGDIGVNRVSVYYRLGCLPRR